MIQIEIDPISSPGAARCRPAPSPPFAVPPRRTARPRLSLAGSDAPRPRLWMDAPPPRRWMDAPPPTVDARLPDLLPGGLRRASPTNPCIGGERNSPLLSVSLARASLARRRSHRVLLVVPLVLPVVAIARIVAAVCRSSRSGQHAPSLLCPRTPLVPRIVVCSPAPPRCPLPLAPCPAMACLPSHLQPAPSPPRRRWHARPQRPPGFAR